MTSGMKSLGIIVYPDGSQAEIFQVELSHPMIVQLKRPRRLTLAPFLLVLAMLLQVGCVHLPVQGSKPICLLDYDSGVKYCEYDSWQACHADLRDRSICYRR